MLCWYENITEICLCRGSRLKNFLQGLSHCLRSGVTYASLFGAVRKQSKRQREGMESQVRRRIGLTISGLQNHSTITKTGVWPGRRKLRSNPATLYSTRQLALFSTFTIRLCFGTSRQDFDALRGHILRKYVVQWHALMKRAMPRSKTSFRAHLEFHLPLAVPRSCPTIRIPLL